MNLPYLTPLPLSFTTIKNKNSNGRCLLCDRKYTVVDGYIYGIVYDYFYVCNYCIETEFSFSYPDAMDYLKKNVDAFIIGIKDVPLSTFDANKQN